MNRRTALLRSLLSVGAPLVAQRSVAGGEIYLSTTSSGLPVYSSEPLGLGSRLYLTISPAPRPSQPRRSSSLFPPRASTLGTYGQLSWPAGATGVVQLAAAAARAYAVPQALLLAVMHAESAFNPQARSPVGAIGLMQVMPATGRRYGVERNLIEPSINIDVGARYLRDLLDLFGGSRELALAAYNAGEGAVLKYGRRIPPYPETRAYVPKVLQLFERYRERVPSVPEN